MKITKPNLINDNILNIFTMLDVIPQKLVFIDKNMEDIICKNNGTKTILFKIKTNDIQAIDARPSQGNIPPGTSIKISVRKAKSKLTANIKIKISYAECLNKQINENNFKQFWDQVSKQASSTLIHVEQIQNKSQNKKQEINQKSKTQESASMFKSMNIGPTSTISDQISARVEETKTVKDVQISRQKENRQNKIQQQKKKEQIQSQLKYLQQMKADIKQNIEKVQQNIQKQQHKIIQQSFKKQQVNIMEIFTKPYVFIPLILIAFAIGFISGSSTSHM